MAALDRKYFRHACPNAKSMEIGTDDPAAAAIFSSPDLPLAAVDEAAASLTAALDLSAGGRVGPDRGELRTSAMDIDRFAETESALAVTDRLWRAEMLRVFGPDGVLLHGFGAERQGAPGTRLRTAFEARRSAIAAWRHVRRRAA